MPLPSRFAAPRATKLLPGLVLGLFLPLAAIDAARPDFAPADTLIQKWMDAGCYPGGGFWVTDKAGLTLHERYWKGFTPETTVMIASASKWLEAATLMAVVDEGKLSLDVPISTYLPELTGPAGKNTLRQMMSHTSSLNSITPAPEEGNAGIDQFPARLAAGHTDVKPGALFSYGGTDLAVAARAIEVVTGQPWLTVFAERIAKPCRMKHTVTGHNLWTFSGIVGADSFPCSNAADYMNFLQMLLHDGEFEGRRVLSAAAVREMQADQIGRAEVRRPEYPEQALGQTHHGVYGLGEWRLFVDEKGEAVIVSSPSFAGFFPWIDKKRGLAAVFVGRATGGIDAFHASAALVPLVNQSVDTQVGQK